MDEGTKLCVLQINHGQSDIWLEADGKELTQRRRLATNEVLNVTRRHCLPDVFEKFYADYRTAVDQITALTVPNLEAIATELRLKA
jgi:hypothetical protein